MVFLKQYWSHLIAIALFLIVIFGSFYLGGALKEARDYKKSLEQANKELKDLKEANKISIENAKELVDSARIYQIFAEREASKVPAIEKKIHKVKKETNEKISNLDSFSVKSHLRLFTETTTRFKGDTLN